MPHTFLYYFDANIGAGSGSVPILPTQAQQDEWNRAVQNGYGKNKRQHEKRSNFYLFSGADNHNTDDTAATTTNNNSNNNNNNHQSASQSNNNNSNDPHQHQHQHSHSQNSNFPADDDTNAMMLGGGGGGGGGHAADASKYTSLQPAGIIDLECYTSINRSSNNPLVLELAGDDMVNPDLRAFYFCANAQEEADDWSDALLNKRHAALMDECDAYKQVCDGFAQQLQSLHVDLDNAIRQQEEYQEELYQVRSQSEDIRRTCWTMVEEVFDKKSLVPKEDFRANLDRARRQDMGVATAVQLLRDYTNSVSNKCNELVERNQELEIDLKQVGQSDQQRVDELQAELEALQKTYQSEKRQWELQVETLTVKQEQSQKELQDVQKELSSTRMEMTMYQNQQKNKSNLLQEHKKILKKEVIELRAKLDDALSEVSTLKHQQNSTVVLAQQEKERNKLLERYVEKIESQVKVQQNMMEIMSHSAACSDYGDRSVDFGAGSIRSPTANFQRQILHDDDDDDDDEVDEDDDDDDQPAAGSKLNSEEEEEDDPNIVVPIKKSGGRRLFNVEDDAKSHMSELTEDRTQRHFESYRDSFHSNPNASPKMSYSKHKSQRSQQLRSPGPPSYVIGSGPPPRDARGGRDFKSGQQSPNMIRGKSSSSSLPPGPTPSRTRKFKSPRSADKHQENMSTSSEQRLSVAQKARLNADERAKTVQVWMDEKTEASLKKKNLIGFIGSDNDKEHRMNDNGSQASGLWRNLEEAFLGPRSEDIVFSDQASVSDSSEQTDSSDNMEERKPKSSNRSNRRKSTDSVCSSVSKIDVWQCIFLEIGICFGHSHSQSFSLSNPRHYPSNNALRCREISNCSS